MTEMSTAKVILRSAQGHPTCPSTPPSTTTTAQAETTEGQSALTIDAKEETLVIS